MNPKSEYAVFGPGWGSTWLGWPGDGIGSGHLAYRGPDREEAKRVLAERVLAIARMRQQPQWRNLLDSYALYERDEHGEWRLARRRIRESSKTCRETGATCYSIDGSPFCEECGEPMYR